MKTLISFSEPQTEMSYSEVASRSRTVRKFNVYVYQFRKQIRKSARRRRLWWAKVTSGGEDEPHH
ncbi:MAG: hypothetical protein GVY26_19335 [Bacteroidetes bacterium]|nr:hypothetical protein [Bacteroidota bacterium]